MHSATHPIPKDLTTVIVSRLATHTEADLVSRSADPFSIDDPCRVSPTGMHQPYASCGEVVCVHCAKIFWR